MIMCHRLLLLNLLALVLFSCQQPPVVPPDRSGFSETWRFSKGDFEKGAQPDFADGEWRTVDIPHDWAIEGPFDVKYNARTGGLPVHGTAWYRKHFTATRDMKGKHVSVFFDGVMNNSTVYLNGNTVGERPFGYMGFEVDLTPHLKIGEDNVIAVRVAPEDLASRWYSGAGIYRNVRLLVKDPVHIPEWGTYITTPKVTDASADVSILTSVRNTGSGAVQGELTTLIRDEAGKVVATQTTPIAVGAGETRDLPVKLTIDNPVRWDIGKPYLYQVSSTVSAGGRPTDTYESSFGVRTISFDATAGFLLNDRQVTFKGVCMHHDLGPLGAAVNYRATERQMEIMQSMGANALRTSHNPPSPEMLEICDRLGIVVLDEAFDEWKVPKVINGYNKVFDEWHERDLRDMIKRDRNHPSVIMWSIGNEILEQGKADGWKVAKMLNDICHDEDPTRPTTAGFNNYGGAFKNKLAYQVDIVGLNYKPYQYEQTISQNPDMIVYGSETSSQTSSRGEYPLPLTGDLNKETGHVSSYDVVVGPGWAYPPDVEFDALADNPTILGEFIWTGVDYLGEPTPYGGRDNSTNGYWNDDWPSHASYFAPVDLSGFPKDRYYLYQSQWTTEPMVHLLPHWNWRGREGEDIPVFVYTNGEEAELFLNGKSLGKKVKGVDITPIPAEFRGFERGMYPSKHRLSWSVPYSPGELKVVAYRDGKAVAQKKVQTAGEPAGIFLEADRSTITADGQDLAFVKVVVVDANGIPCPKANNEITFTVTGKGKLAAVSNGDQTSLELFQADQRKAFNGQCLAIVRAYESAGAATITATSPGLQSQTIEITVQ